MGSLYWSSCPKKCKRNTGLYYNIGEGAYEEGDSIAVAGGGRAVVFDFHNVVDIFEPKESWFAR